MGEVILSEMHLPAVAKVKDDRLGIWDLVMPFPGQCLVFCATKS